MWSSICSVSLSIAKEKFAQKPRWKKKKSNDSWLVNCISRIIHYCLGYSLLPYLHNNLLQISNAALCPWWWQITTKVIHTGYNISITVEHTEVNSDDSKTRVSGGFGSALCNQGTGSLYIPGKQLQLGWGMGLWSGKRWCSAHPGVKGSSKPRRIHHGRASFSRLWDEFSLCFHETGF